MMFAWLFGEISEYKMVYSEASYTLVTHLEIVTYPKKLRKLHKKKRNPAICGSECSGWDRCCMEFSAFVVCASV